MKFQLRPATVEDLGQILEIYNDEIIHGTANWHEKPKTLDIYTLWYQNLLKDNYPMWVAYDPEQQRVAGYAYYSDFRPLIGYRHTVEHSVFISPDYKRQGLGIALMQCIIDSAIEQKRHVMVGAIDSENQASIVLHERLGFVQTGYMPQVGTKFGVWRDLVLMQRMLSDASEI